MNNLTKEQEDDVKERVEKANTYLKELELACEVQTVNVNLGAIDPKFGNIFGTLLQPYLQDTKYRKEFIKSPLSKEDLKK